MKKILDSIKALIIFTFIKNPRKVIKKILLSSKHFISRHPKLKRKIIDILDAFPSLKKRLQKVGKHPSKSMYHIPLTPEILSPEAYHIYHKLNRHIQTKSIT